VNRPRLAPNWTTLAGAIEGVLEAMAAPLPRHAVMGLTGCAFTFALARGETGVAGAAGIHAFDTIRLEERLARTGVRFERFLGGRAERRDAIAWMTARTARGTPVVAWALRLREWGIVQAVDEAAQTFAVDDLLTPEVGPSAAWDDWPWAGERVDLLAPVGHGVEEDALEAVAAALRDAAAFLSGEIRPEGMPSGADALEEWAAAFEEGRPIDRSGNAYCLAALEAARSDGAAFFEELAQALSNTAEPLRRAAAALRREAAELSQLVTLFPYPAGGAGALTSPGMRRIAAAVLRRAARWEREAAQAAAAAAAGLSSASGSSAG